MLVYFCVATLIAQVILLGYLGFRWQLDRGKLVQILAIAQDIDLFALRDEAEGRRDEIPPEQVSSEEIIEARAVKFRNLELQEQALKNAQDQIRLGRNKLAAELKQYKQTNGQFAAELVALREGAVREGRDEVRLMLQDMKAKQAKEQLVEMLEKGEMDEVVVLLVGMSGANRKKILGEFKTTEEAEKLGEILRIIRQGAPQSKLAEQAQEQLGQANLAGN